MSVRETALNILIRARDLASAPLTRFRREVENTDNSTHRAAGSVDEFGDALSNNAQEAGLFAQGLSFVSGKLGGLLAGAAALVGFGGALQSSRDFEKQLSKVNAVAGASTEEFAQLRAAAEEAGSTTRYTATQAAEGLEILARAGVGVNDSISLLPTLLNVATAEQLSLAEAASLVTDTLSIMGLAIDKGASSADILAKGASLSNTTMQELGQAISYTGQYAKESDIDLAKLVATLDVLASNGLRGERAGTGLRSILSQLSDPATKAAKAVSALGIDVKNFDAVIDGLKSPAADAQAAINAFGIEAGPTLRALIAEGTEGIDKFKASLDESEGSVKEMADTINKNFDGAMISFESRLDSVRRKLTDPLLKPLARDIKDFTQSLSDFSPAFEALGSTVTFLFDRISGLVKFFGNSFAVALELVTSVGMSIPVVLAETELAIDKLLNKVGLVSDGQVKKLETEVGALKAARNALFDAAVEDANDAKNAILQLFGLLDEAGKKGATVTEETASGVKNIGEAAEKAGTQAEDGLGKAAEAVINVKDQAIAAAAAFKESAAGATEAGKGIREVFDTALSAATTKQDIEAVTRELVNLYNEGKISAYSYGLGMKAASEAMGELEKKADKLAVVAPKISTAFENMTKSDVKEYIKTLESGIEDLSEMFDQGKITVEQYTLSEKHLSKELANAKKLFKDEVRDTDVNTKAIDANKAAIDRLTSARQAFGENSPQFSDAQGAIEKAMSDVATEMAKQKEVLENLGEQYRNGLISQDEFGNKAAMLRPTIAALSTEYNTLAASISKVADAQEEASSRNERMAKESDSRDSERDAKRKQQNKSHTIFIQNLDHESDSLYELAERNKYLTGVINTANKARTRAFIKISETVKGLAQHEQAVISDTIRLKELNKIMSEGAYSAADLSKAMSWATSATNKLNSSTLNGLISSIRTAQDEMRVFREEAVDAGRAIEQELLEATGDYSGAIAANFNSRAAELERKLEEARRAKDKISEISYRTALANLNQLRSVELQKAKEREEQEKSQAQAQGSVDNTANTPSKIVRVQFQNPEGRIVSGDFNQLDAGDMLRMLEDAKFVSS